MSDARMRELERKWKQSGSAEDEAAYLLERVRIGGIPQIHLDALADFGDPAAMLAVSVNEPLELPEAVQNLSNISEDAVIRAGIALARAFFETHLGNAGAFFDSNHYAVAYFAIERWFVTKANRDANEAMTTAAMSVDAEWLVVDNLETDRAVDFAEAHDIALALEVINHVVDIAHQSLHDTIKIVVRVIENIRESEDHPEPEKLIRHMILLDLKPWLVGDTDPIRDRVQARS